MEHNLITRYKDFIQRREKLLKLQEDLAIKPTKFRRTQQAKQANVLTKMRQSIMAAIYDRTKLHAERYHLDKLVVRLRRTIRRRYELTANEERLEQEPTNDRLRRKVKQEIEDLEIIEPEVMAEAIKAIDKIIDLESRDE